MTKTIAILGACSPVGVSIAHELAAGKYFLLLMDNERERLETLRQALLNAGSQAMIEVATCAYESAWEADTIILAFCEQELPASAQLIREVATGKRVIRIIDDSASTAAEQSVLSGYGTDSLQTVLPHSGIVWASVADFRHKAVDLFQE